MAQRGATHHKGTRDKAPSSRSHQDPPDGRGRVDSVLSNQTPYQGTSNVPRSLRKNSNEDEHNKDDDYRVRALSQAEPIDIPPLKGKESRHADIANSHESWTREEANVRPQQAPGWNLPPPSDPARHFDLVPGNASLRGSSEWGPQLVSKTTAYSIGRSAARTNLDNFAPPPSGARPNAAFGRTPGEISYQPASKPEPSNLTPLGQKFAQIRVGQFMECVDFIISNQGVLKENAQHYLREAGALYRKSKIQDARACVQQAIIIDHCSDLDKNDTTEYLSDLATSRKSTVNKLLSNVDKTFATIKAKSDESTPSEDSGTQHATPFTNNRHMTSEHQNRPGGYRPLPSPFPTTSDLVNRFSAINVTLNDTLPVPRPPAPEAAKKNRHKATAGSRASQSSAGHHGSRNSLLPEQIQLRGTEGEFEPLDRRYRQRRDKADYFIVGRVFAILWHENMGITKQKPGPDVKFTRDNRFGEKIFSHIRRMIIVRQRYGYCWCVAINTYGGKGLVDKNRSDAEVQSHTIVYESSLRPALFKEEQGLMTKESIAIDMVEGHTLDKASRLNYAKVSTVEHNVKVMDIGMVSLTSMPYLLSHWRDETAQ